MFFKKNENHRIPEDLNYDDFTSFAGTVIDYEPSKNLLQ